MSGRSLKQRVLITNPEGFHMRPVTAFAQKAAAFASNVAVSRDGRTVNGKSPWDMMLMLSPQGTELELEVDGPDADEALEALVALLNSPSQADSPAG
jgi:phosphotransferase system HPr (HPr) family protein